MRSIKSLLRLMGAISLTTVTASSIVACGKESVKELDTKIAKNLGLADELGNGLKEVALKWEENKPSFSIDTSNVSVTNLLENDATTGEVKAKDKESFDFLKNILQVKLTSGTKFEDGKFNAVDVAKIKNQVSNTNISLVKKVNDKDEETLIVKSGTYNLQFFKEDNKTSLTDKYQVKIKINTNALFDMFTNVSIKVGEPEFIYSTSPIYSFHVNGLVSESANWIANKQQAPLISQARTDKAIKFNNFETLIGWKAVFTVKELPNKPVNARWISSDQIKLSISLNKGNETINVVNTIVFNAANKP